jgi:predicted SAM-dependent methyltransferase
MQSAHPFLGTYLAGPGPHRLEIGAGLNIKPGWLTTDLYPDPASNVIALDATERFPLPDACFDYVYSEHMIEHVPFASGQSMLRECFRILKPGGTVRIVTPSIGMLLRVMSADRGPLEARYRDWSVGCWVPDAPLVTNAFFLNNFVRNWGHQFVYDQETMRYAMAAAGFEAIAAREINDSPHAALQDLENEARMPRGFLALESMIMEATKPDLRKPLPLRGKELARGKPALQSSVAEWSHESTPQADAARAVSGNFTAAYNCHTANENDPWWQVDLERLCRIREVRIHNRDSTPSVMARAGRLAIKLSADGRDWPVSFRREDGEAAFATFTWRPAAPVNARFVRIELAGYNVLHLKQVEVFGEAL